MSGKGSSPRPFSVPRKKFDDNWDRIFGKKTKEKYCSECGIVADSEPLGVPCSLPNCPKESIAG